MPVEIRARAFASPVHVMPSAEGGIRLLLPDGHSLTLTAEAVARSAAMMARAARQGGKARRGLRAARPADGAQEVADAGALDGLQSRRAS